MQTFLPYTQFQLSLKVLDRKRAGKQRVEAKQILDLIECRTHNNWLNHPCVRMWDGHNQFLRFYYNESLQEWERRGFLNKKLVNLPARVEQRIPSWLFDSRLHYSHRANLVKKDPDHYGPMWPDVRPDTPYWWPVELKTKKKQEELDEFWGWHQCFRNDSSESDEYPDQIILEERNERQNNPSWHHIND